MTTIPKPPFRVQKSAQPLSFREKNMSHRIMVNGQMFRETDIGIDYAQGVAEGLVEGWRIRGIKDIPTVEVLDSSGAVVWPNKDHK